MKFAVQGLIFRAMDWISTMQDVPYFGAVPRYRLIGAGIVCVSAGLLLYSITDQVVALAAHALHKVAR